MAIKMGTSLSNGIPSLFEYFSLINGPKFKELEQFNNRFLSLHKENLKIYSDRWVSNPLKQWSRQWEYPYVLSKLLALENLCGLRVLDAGSGLTFFPYYLCKLGANIYCCDIDSTLKKQYSAINNARGESIDFQVQNLANLKYPDGQFDVVYCVSVLEHTTSHNCIISNFKRVLKPGGLLILSFDVSLGFFGIRKANSLTDKLAKNFKPLGVSDLKVPLNFDKKNFLSTYYFKENNYFELLPWKDMRNFELLTVLCSTYERI